MVEICTSDDAVLGQETKQSEGCKKLRITKQIDFTKKSGVEAACNAIYGPYDVVFMSLPCVGGCPWNYVNAIKGPEAVRRIRGYWALFGVLWRGVEKVLALAFEKGATIVIEWPRPCRYWHVEKVRKAMEKYRLEL